ncbi:DUF2267 domain-containing protein [Corallococcus praedator]|uniref:DUF2267 domain-containing protein n=2 Tax=Corallococcus TaxID=83461 RepID=A0ABX9QFB9_9BACT|nr:DUF2267 domain-containing protein [Corallococcus sp. CA047B]RKH29922.1 DUF2267 domain-containing protein [Corallococcus sp. CA031C]RKI02167.1 DUF2267 domain-containing protein [Corallococcus praedator]
MAGSRACPPGPPPFRGLDTCSVTPGTWRLFPQVGGRRWGRRRPGPGWLDAANGRGDGHLGAALPSPNPRCAMAQSHESEAEKQARHERRHDSHLRATYAAFLRHLEEVSGLPRNLAECAAVSVLTTLERRVLPEGARNLEAQLPRLLVAFLPPAEERPARLQRFGQEEFIESVAEDLKLPVDRAELVIRAVLRAFQDQITEGEADKFASNLPADLQALWRLTQ